MSHQPTPSDGPISRSRFPKTDRDLIKLHLLSPGVELLLSQQVETFIRVTKQLSPKHQYPENLAPLPNPLELVQGETLVICKEANETVFSVECPLEYGNIPAPNSEKNWIDLLMWHRKPLENGKWSENSLRHYRVVPPGKEPIQRFLTLLRSRALIYGKIRGSGAK